MALTEGRRRRATHRRYFRKSWFEHLFLQYGGGAHLLTPLTRWKLWNRVCWVVIVLGILGWIIGLWLSRSISE